MFVIITPDTICKEEVNLLKYFTSFENVRLHIRKPKFTEVELSAYLHQFSESTLIKSSLHSHHNLVDQFCVGGVHFTSRLQAKLADDLKHIVDRWRIKGKCVSASLHCLEELSDLWDYSFLSPVFNSISKKNYEGEQFNVRSRNDKIIALGGLTLQNISESKKLGYKGIAVLGSLWHQIIKPKKAFIELYDEYQKCFT